MNNNIIKSITNTELLASIQRMAWNAFQLDLFFPDDYPNYVPRTTLECLVVSRARYNFLCKFVRTAEAKLKAGQISEEDFDRRVRKCISLRDEMSKLISELLISMSQPVSLEAVDAFLHALCEVGFPKELTEDVKELLVDKVTYGIMDDSAVFYIHFRHIGYDDPHELPPEILMPDFPLKENVTEKASGKTRFAGGSTNDSIF